MFDNWLLLSTQNAPFTNFHTQAHIINIISHTFSAQICYIVWISWHWFSSSIRNYVDLNIQRATCILLSFSSSHFYFFKRFSHSLSYYPFIQILWIDFFSMCVAQSLSLSLYVSVIFLHFFSSYSAILFCGYNGAWKRCTKTVLFVHRYTKDFAVCVMCINITFILLFAFSFIFFSNFSSFWIKIDGTFNTGAY